MRLYIHVYVYVATYTQNLTQEKICNSWKFAAGIINDHKQSLIIAHNTAYVTTAWGTNDGTKPIDIYIYIYMYTFYVVGLAAIALPRNALPARRPLRDAQSACSRQHRRGQLEELDRSQTARLDRSGSYARAPQRGGNPAEKTTAKKPHQLKTPVLGEAAKYINKFNSLSLCSYVNFS